MKAELFKSGNLKFKVILTCRGQRSYHIGCENQCQLVVRPQTEFESIKVIVPQYPTSLNRIQDPVDGSLLFFTGENLVVDVALVDKFGSTVPKEVSNNEFSSRFFYGEKSLSLDGYSRAGMLTYFLSGNNLVLFKEMPPRANDFYKIMISY